MPIQCKSGFCFGDYCVKSIVADKYVSKGCENKTKNGIYFDGNYGGVNLLNNNNGKQNYETFHVSARSLEDNQQINNEDQLKSSTLRYPDKSNSNKISSSLGVAVPNGCIKMNVFGQPNIICYCNDADYCNGGYYLKQMKIFTIIISIFCFLFKYF